MPFGKKKSEAKSPEAVFSQPYQSAKADTASGDFDKIDDTVQKIANPILQAKAFYQANSTTLNAAADALVNLGDNEGLQRAAKDILQPVRKIIDGLDQLTKVHPFIAVAVLLFKAVIELEIKRRENDRRTTALVLQMADMMGTLLQLKDVKDPDLKTETGDTVSGRMQLLMTQIEGDVKNCGKAIDAYRKQHVMVKFIKSPMWEGKLVAIGNGLGDRKTQIIFALSIHTAVGVDHINAQAVEMQAKLDLVLQHMVEKKSPTEIEWEKEMDKLGGREACMEDPAKMAKVAAIFASKDGASLEGESEDTGGRGGKKDGDISAAEKHALNVSVDDLIDENAELYERKLTQQTEQIKDAIAQSTSLILMRLDSGPHERIKHPVIRHVWEEMKWRSSIKSRTFVLALHDYYLDRAVFSAATAHTATPENPDNPPTGSKPSPELTHDPEDDWCLQYLTVFHVPAIMEAFDDDASGYVKIKEVNEFTDEIPEDWNLLQWLAYWGAGWKVEITKYSCRILKVLSKMVEIQRNSLSANNDDIIGYLHKKCLGHAKCLTHLASEDTSVDEGLLKLVNSRMETDIEEWTGILEEGKYEIDSADTFTQLSGGRRVESYVYPALYVLLRHHLRLAKLAQSHILNIEEWVTAAWSVFYVMDAVFSRKTQLEESFRQQRVDPESQFVYFAGGTFTELGSVSTKPQYVSGFEPNDNQEAREEEKILTSEPAPITKILKYELIGLDNSQYLRPWTEPALSKYRPANLEKDISRPLALFRLAGKAVLAQVKERLHRRTWAAMKQRRDNRIEFIKLNVKYDRHEDFTEYTMRPIPSEDPQPLTEEEDKRLTELEKIIPERDQTFYISLGELEFRKDIFHTQIACDGCGAYPPIGIRYRCIDCDDLDYCERCEASHPAVNASGNTTHGDNHNIVKVPWPLTKATMQKYKLQATDVIKDRSSPPKRKKRVVAEDSESESEDEGPSGDDDDSEEGSESGSESESEEEKDAAPQAQPSTDGAAAEKAKDPAAPPVKTTIACHAGCGKEDLSIHYVCLDCAEEYVLCPECDETLTKDHKHNGLDVHANATSKPPSDEKLTAGPPSSSPAAPTSTPTEAQQKHNAKHVVLKINELKHIKPVVKAQEDSTDHVVLISQLRGEVVSKFGNVESRFSELEARFTKLEDLLGRIASHMGMPSAS